MRGGEDALTSNQQSAVSSQHSAKTKGPFQSPESPRSRDIPPQRAKSRLAGGPGHRRHRRCKTLPLINADKRGFNFHRRGRKDRKAKKAPLIAAPLLFQTSVDPCESVARV